MIRSMTGYGEAEVETPVGRLRLEVKTVNHRFFNTSVRTPSGFDRHEQALVSALKERGIARGHVNVSLSLDRDAAADDGSVPVDLERARGYKKALEAVQSEFALPGVVDLGMIARFHDVFREADPGSAAPEIETDALEALAVHPGGGEAEAILVRALGRISRLQLDAEALAAMPSLPAARPPASERDTLCSDCITSPPES